MAAAAPQPTTVRRSPRRKRSHCPMRDDKPAPSCVKPASMPTEAPKPEEIAVSKVSPMLSVNDILPPKRALASMASTTSWARAPHQRLGRSCEQPADDRHQRHAPPVE